MGAVNGGVGRAAELETQQLTDMGSASRWIARSLVLVLVPVAPCRASSYLSARLGPSNLFLLRPLHV